MGIDDSPSRRSATSHGQFMVDDTARVDISKISGFSVQVSGFSTAFP